MKNLEEVLRPLITIADRYDQNRLDDETRKFWGQNGENKNERDPKDIILAWDWGGGTLLTLQDCLDARETWNRLRDDLK